MYTIALVVAAATSSAGYSAEFAGKQIRVIVPGGPAGGYGLYGQLAAQHLGRFVPGNPAVAVSHMPGAAGLAAMNHLYEAAPQDGTVIAVMQQDLATNQARKLPGLRYDATRFSYLGRATANVPAHMIWHTSKAKTIEDVRRYEVVTGAVGTGGTHNDLPRAQNALIGTKWKIVGGYRGNNETRIAMERGEVHAAVTPATLLNEQLKPWLLEGKVRIVVQYADFRHPAIPDVPAIVELTDNEETRSIFKFLVSVSTLGRAYAAPPGVPSETVAMLRKAVQAMFNDPQFKADAHKRGADLLPMPGEELGLYVKQILDTPQAIIQKTNDVLGQR